MVGGGKVSVYLCTWLERIEKGKERFSGDLNGCVWCYENEGRVVIIGDFNFQLNYMERK